MLLKVELIGFTKPSGSTGVNSADELVAYCARVSNPGNQNNQKTAPKLLKYLIIKILKIFNLPYPISLLGGPDSVTIK